LLEPLDVGPGGWAGAQKADPIHLPRVLRLSSERSGEEATREDTYERPTLHYSIT